MTDELDRLNAAFGLVHEIAKMTIDGDIMVDGEEYWADGNDDEIDALYNFVHRARELLDHPDPKTGVELSDEEKEAGIGSGGRVRDAGLYQARGWGRRQRD